MIFFYFFLDFFLNFLIFLDFFIPFKVTKGY